MHRIRSPGQQQRANHHRRDGQGWRDPPHPESVLRESRPSMRLLHSRNDNAGGLAAEGESEPYGRGNQVGNLRESVQVHRLSEYRKVDTSSCDRDARWRWRQFTLASPRPSPGGRGSWAPDLKGEETRTGSDSTREANRRRQGGSGAGLRQAKRMHSIGLPVSSIIPLATLGALRSAHVLMARW